MKDLEIITGPGVPWEYIFQKDYNGKMLLKYDAIIIGAGITGCTLAAYLADYGKNALIIDKAKRIGGQCQDFKHDNYYIHDFGPHIFHTSNDRVWLFANRFTKFNNFINSPLVWASNSKLYNLPFNMNMLARVYATYRPEIIREAIDDEIQEAIGKYNIDKENPKNLKEQALILIGERLYELFIKEYTEKQWGCSCEELDPSIIRRLPIRLTYNNNYFNDRYQGIPVKGYSNMMRNMLVNKTLTGRSHTLLLNTDWNEGYTHILKYAIEYDAPIFYTGPIDELCGGKFGPLGWRSLGFSTQSVPVPNYQGNAVVNYATDIVNYTRIIEHKHFTCLDEKSINEFPTSFITYEYPLKWRNGLPKYYPINNQENQEILVKYQEAVKLGLPHFYLIGRQAEYRYKDMAPSIEDALNLIDELLTQ